MTAPKIPLLGGIIAPLHNGAPNAVPPVAAIPNLIASPADKALQPVGVQDVFEYHLWLMPGLDPVQRFWLYAVDDNNPGVQYTIWSALLSVLTTQPHGKPIKILDGYPVRGNISLYLEIECNDQGDEYPIGAQAYGYAYRVGQGTQTQRERRFIGEPAADNELSFGLPLVVAPGGRRIVHTFEPGRIDEISLAFGFPVPPDSSGDEGFCRLIFEDANNNPVIPAHSVPVWIELQQLNYFRDPQSVYRIYQAVFTPNTYPNLDHIAIVLDNEPARDLYVHGYFNRR